MPLRSDWSDDACPIARGIDFVGDPLVLLILREAFAGALRFDQFASRTGMTDRALSGRLKDLVAKGVLERVELTEGVRPRAEYRLTQAGVDALPILHAFALWAEKHAASSEQGNITITCRSCGSAAQSVDTCRSCGKPLDAGNVNWMRPASGDVAPTPIVGIPSAY